MRMRIGDTIYRPKMEILIATGLAGREKRKKLYMCQKDGYVGKAWNMREHIKKMHPEYLVAVGKARTGSAYRNSMSVERME